MLRHDTIERIAARFAVQPAYLRPARGHACRAATEQNVERRTTQRLVERQQHEPELGGRRAKEAVAAARREHRTLDVETVVARPDATEQQPMVHVNVHE